MITNKTLLPLQLNGDLKRGGWLLTGQVSNDTDAVTRGLNVRCLGKSYAKADMLWTEYFNGHILADPDFNFSRFNSEMRFQAGTPDAFLRGESLQDISFTSQATPANSHEITNLAFDDVITHIMERHTNYIYDADGSNGSPDGIIYTTDIDASTPISLFIVRGSNNLWSTLQKVAASENHIIYFTRTGTLKYKPVPIAQSPLPSVKGTIEKEHIRGTVSVSFPNSQPGQRVGQVMLTTVKDSDEVFTSEYPWPPADGKILKKQRGIWADSQSRSDTIAEDMYRWETRSYTVQLSVDPGLVLYGDDGTGLDIGDRIRLTYNGPIEDLSTGHGMHIFFSSTSMFVYGVGVRFDNQGKMAEATLTLEHDNS